MSRFLAVATLAVAVVIIVGGAVSTLAGEEARHRAAMHAIEEERAAWQLAEDQRQALATQGARDASATLVALGWGAALLLAVAGGGFGLLVASERFWARRELVWPRQDGLLPVPVGQLAGTAPAALAGYHQARIAAAQQVRNVTIKEAPMQGQTSQQVSVPTQRIAAPTFGSLLENNLDMLRSQFVLGYVDGEPLTGDWRDLYSSAVAGLSGSGKTTTLRYLACQAALHGARFIVLDPHADAGEESLAGALRYLLTQGDHIGKVVATPKEMLLTLGHVREGLQQQLAHPRPDLKPLLVCVDEFTSLMGRSDVGPALAECLEAIAQEGRKVGYYALISGQIWTADRSGGTALRDALASAYVHRMKPEQARRLLPNAEARRAGELAPGRALLARTSGEVVEVAIPLTTSADVRRVARMLAWGGQLSGGYSPATGPATQIVDAVAVEKPEVATVAVPEEAQRAATLFLSGMSMAEVTKELRGVSSSQGARYQAALAEVQGLVRQALKGGWKDGR